MILGVGIDLIQNSRVERALGNGKWRAADGVFSSREIVQCSAARKPVSGYARCFALKEATLKALGKSPPNLAAFREIEIEFGTALEPVIRLHGRLKMEFQRLKATKIKACVASTAAVTTAVVFVEA